MRWYWDYQSTIRQQLGEVKLEIISNVKKWICWIAWKWNQDHFVSEAWFERVVKEKKIKEHVKIHSEFVGYPVSFPADKRAAERVSDDEGEKKHD